MNSSSLSHHPKSLCRQIHSHSKHDDDGNSCWAGQRSLTPLRTLHGKSQSQVRLTSEMKTSPRRDRERWLFIDYIHYNVIWMCTHNRSIVSNVSLFSAAREVCLRNSTLFFRGLFNSNFGNLSAPAGGGRQGWCVYLCWINKTFLLARLRKPLRSHRTRDNIMLTASSGPSHNFKLPGGTWTEVLVDGPQW